MEPTGRAKKQGVTAKPHAGMKMYAIDMQTHECAEVMPEATTAKALYAKPHPMLIKMQNDLVRQERHHKVTNDPGKFYAWAINEKNAVKKFRKALTAARTPRAAGESYPPQPPVPETSAEKSGAPSSSDQP